MPRKPKSDPPKKYPGPGMVPHEDKKPRYTVDVPECPPEFMEEILKAGQDPNWHNVVEKSNPAGAAKALWMLAQGFSISRICRETQIARHSINRLAFRHSDTLESKRKEFSRAYAMAAYTYTDLLNEKADRLMENPELLDAISPDKIALTIGIMTDKSAMLSGMAGTIVEVRRGASVADANEMIMAARQRIAEKNKVIEAEVIDNPALNQEDIASEPEA